MISDRFSEHLQSDLTQIEKDGLYKREHVLRSKQANLVELADVDDVLNLCANNYLGLAGDEVLEQAAQKALGRYGYGMASVRFICGTQETHKTLEARLSRFTRMEDTILYSSCFDANTGLFETILGEQDGLISDALNHASIIDGIRLCKAARYRYANNDMASLEHQLQAAADARFRLIATDGVFSMDGVTANLKGICDLAERYDAMVMVDDSHGVGVLGRRGAGTVEYCGVEGRVDIVTGTLGKALGGASGGYTAASKEIVAWLRQRSRPYLFSNTLAPVIAGTSVAAIDRVESGQKLRERLARNSTRFRDEMSRLGFTLKGSDHPIIPVIVGDARLAGDMSDRLLERGVYVIGFSYPVVPHGQARIRTQMSATHTDEDIDRALEAFADVGRDLGAIP